MGWGSSPEGLMGQESQILEVQHLGVTVSPLLVWRLYPEAPGSEVGQKISSQMG